jgi:hypothetical protein
MRYGFPALLISTGALVVAGGLTLAAATTGTGTTGARPVAFTVPAEPVQQASTGAAPAQVTTTTVVPAARVVLRTRSDIRPASWAVRTSEPPGAAR